jgi:hypothetical protein
LKRAAGTALAIALAVLPAASAQAHARRSAVAARAGGPWSGLLHPARFSPGAMLLLTDGEVLVQDQGPRNGGARGWWLLRPDRNGSYVRGTWKRAASLPSGYGPISFASAVLPDGRVLIEGGEDNLGHTTVETNQGAIYDPVANRWTPVAPPVSSTGDWDTIGDAPSAVLADGSFMFGTTATPAEAIFDASTLTWTATGSGKADANAEEGWTLLPDGDLLTVDAVDAPNTELYDPTSGAWHSAGATPTSLADRSFEVGPDVLMPDGRVLATGADGRTALYDTATGSWSAGPSFPVIGGKRYDIADGPAAVLPDGEVLLEASPGDYHPPAHFFLFHGTALTRTADAPASRSEASSYGYMLVLPTGQILLDARLGVLYVYSSKGRPKRAWRPQLTSVPTSLAPGHTYTLTGRQLGGLTQGSAYGDDFQDATNYPLVRITSRASHRVLYARTSGMTSMSVAPATTSSAAFTLPRAIPRGPATLTVIANGIASAPVTVTIT